VTFFVYSVLLFVITWTATGCVYCCTCWCNKRPVTCLQLVTVVRLVVSGVVRRSVVSMWSLSQLSVVSVWSVVSVVGESLVIVWSVYGQQSVVWSVVILWSVVSVWSVVVVNCRAYEQLKVPHEQLTLIPPQFETPLPPLQPAVSLSYRHILYTLHIIYCSRETHLLYTVHLHSIVCVALICCDLIYTEKLAKSHKNKEL